MTDNEKEKMNQDTHWFTLHASQYNQDDKTKGVITNDCTK